VFSPDHGCCSTSGVRWLMCAWMVLVAGDDLRVASLLPNSGAQFSGRVKPRVGIRGMAEEERPDERAPVVQDIL
jgi:hypothetical protein